MHIGLLGYGFMGGAHAAAIRQIPGVKLVAVSARTRPSAETAVRGNLDLQAEPLPEDVRWTPDWQAIVCDPEIDAVDICLPTQLHREVLEAAFAHGKHVLCEKPMALTEDDCEHLLQLASAAGRTFMVAQVLRWMYPYQYARDFVRSVGPGAIIACRLQRSTGFPHWSAWLRDPARSGGATLDLLCHDLDQVLQWFGAPVGVSAVSLGEVDTMRAAIRYKGDRVISVEGGWLPPETEFSASFTVTTADTELRFQAGALTLTRNGETQTIEQPAQDAYREEIAYFVQCCRTGEPPALCPPVESARAVQLALLLERSRREGGRELPWQ